MEVRRREVKLAGSCNFCDRGTLSGTHSLSFPYRMVNVLQGKHIEVRVCDDCIQTIKNIIK